MTDNYDEIDINLRPVGEIYARFAALGATAQRVDLEFESDEADEEMIYDLETARFDLSSWSRSALRSTLTASERGLIASAIADTDEETFEGHLFDYAATSALAWVLGIADEIPEPGASTETLAGISSRLPRPWDKLDRVPNRIQLRDEELVWEERERWYLRHFRGLLEQDDSGMLAMPDVLADARNLGLGISNDDLLVGSVPYGELGEEERAIVDGYTDACARALTWACGFGTSWDDVPYDDL
jgi:hypothetical protein